MVVFARALLLLAVLLVVVVVVASSSSAARRVVEGDMERRLAAARRLRLTDAASAGRARRLASTADGRKLFSFPSLAYEAEDVGTPSSSSSSASRRRQAPASTWAELNVTGVVVGTKAVEPFVSVADDGTVSGLTVELWRQLAGELNVPFQWRVYSSTPALLDGVAAQEVDLGIAAITVTESREQIFEFSHSYFESGLQLLTRSQEADLVSFIFAPFSVSLWFSVIGLIVVSGHILWYLEKSVGSLGGGEAATSYLAGTFDGMFVASTLLMQSQFHTVHGAAAKLVWVGLSFAAVLFIGAWTANLASFLTLNTLNADIGSVGELRDADVRVGAIAGTSGEEFLVRNGVTRLVYFEDVGSAFDALVASGAGEAKKSEEIGALLYDGPVLNELLQGAPLEAKQGDNAVVLVPNAFTAELYAAAFPSNATLPEGSVELFNAALLRIAERGVLDELRGRFLPPVELGSDTEDSETIPITPAELSGLGVFLLVSFSGAFCCYVADRAFDIESHHLLWGDPEKRTGYQGHHKAHHAERRRRRRARRRHLSSLDVRRTARKSKDGRADTATTATTCDGSNDDDDERENDKAVEEKLTDLDVVSAERGEEKRRSNSGARRRRGRRGGRGGRRREEEEEGESSSDDDDSTVISSSSELSSDSE